MGDGGGLGAEGLFFSSSLPLLFSSLPRHLFFKDMVAAKHDGKMDDDHRMALLLHEHVSEVVGSMLVFHEHSENL